jgi:Dehydrogenases with different specificities (related to short-chain alcohol dehydrogenases)
VVVFDDETSFKGFCNDINKITGILCALINNASSFYPKKITDIVSYDWDTLMSSNLKTPIFLVSALAEKLLKNNGHIVNITDIYAEQGMSGYSVYAAAKAGLYNFTKSLARELAPNVLVNSISPGSILWDVNEPSVGGGGKKIDCVPVLRFGSVVALVLLAASFVAPDSSRLVGS